MTAVTNWLSAIQCLDGVPGPPWEPVVAEQIQATEVRWVSNSTLCRISIAMNSCEVRLAIIQVMNWATNSAVVPGAPPPTPMERDLGEYCQLFGAMNLNDY